MHKVIDLIYFNAGGGHRAAALALQAAISQQKWPWTVRLVNLTDVLDREGQFRRWLGFDPEDFYNLRLRKGWTLGLAQELKLLQALIRMAHLPMQRQLERHWASTAPDLVVSLVPNFNRVLHDALKAVQPHTPYVTVMTDMADHPPHFWIERNQDQTIVCGTDQALAQARAAGYADTQLALTSGMVLRPSFYEAAREVPGLTHEALGLDPRRPTGVVMFGGQGSKQMVRIAEALDHVQLLLLCGHNAVLAQRLKHLQRSAPHAALGFTEHVPAAMQLGQFFIGKPGPASLSEALHLGLPVITLRNAWTMPQERYNTDWLQAQGAGLVVRSVKQIGQAVQTLLADLPRYQAAAAALNNRAVFELPQILAEVLMQAEVAHPRPAQQAQAA